ncbi:MAG: hypothetical protein V8R39_04230 [Clostridia bacterium]
MKNNKGITLIALVVTIIVLLILAGVSIAMLTGQNGILNRGQEAAYKNAVTDAKDQISLKVAECITNWNAKTYGGSTSTGITQSTLDAYIKAELDSVATSIGSKDVTITIPEVPTTSEATISIVSAKNTAISTSCKWKANGDLSSWTDVGF